MRGIGAPLALGEVGDLVSIEGSNTPLIPPAADPSTYKVVQIPTGQRGTEQTLQVMGNLAIEAQSDPQFVAFAQGIVRNCGARDYACMMQAIYDFVVNNLKYQNDPTFCEFVQSPSYAIFVSGTSDCDDQACVVAALALSLGFLGAYRAVFLETPDEASHVFAMLKHPNQRDWTPIDTVAQRGVGWQPSESEWKREPIDYVIVA